MTPGIQPFPARRPLLRPLHSSESAPQFCQFSAHLRTRVPEMSGGGGGASAVREELVPSITTDSNAVSESLSGTASPVQIGYRSVPGGASSPLGISTPQSYGESPAWTPSHPFAEYQRAKGNSFSFGRTHSKRRNKRANSDFVALNTSPASEFLSRWSAQNAVPAPSPDDEGQQIGDYVLGKQIGYGGFSIVREAVTIENGHSTVRAVKVIRKVAASDDGEPAKAHSNLDKEVGIWRELHHRHILPLLVVYETSHAVFCVMELVRGGSLFDIVKKNRSGLSIPLVKRYVYQLATALHYLHDEVGIVHRDIKLENCLVQNAETETEKDRLYLCDFGVAEYANAVLTDDEDLHFEARQRSNSRSPKPITGSLPYASPEMFSDTFEPASPAVDIWAVGVIIFALLSGKLPFQHDLPFKVQQMIKENQPDESLVLAARGDSPETQRALEMMRACLSSKPDERVTAEQLMSSEWLADERAGDNESNIWTEPS